MMNNISAKGGIDYYKFSVMIDGNVTKFFVISDADQTIMAILTIIIQKSNL